MSQAANLCEVREFEKDEARLEEILIEQDYYRDLTLSGNLNELPKVKEVLNEMDSIFEYWEKYHISSTKFRFEKEFYKELDLCIYDRIDKECKNFEKKSSEIERRIRGKQDLEKLIPELESMYNTAKILKKSYERDMEMKLKRINNALERKKKHILPKETNIKKNTPQTFNSIELAVEEPERPSNLVVIKPKINASIDDTITLNSPTFEDILKYYRSEGIIGEEKNAILITLAATYGAQFGIIGDSGSGKTLLALALMKLLPSSYVYELQLASDQSLFNDVDEINGKKFIYISEAQKPLKKKDSTILEIIKTLGEGKDVKRKVTLSKGKVIDYVINGGPKIIFTLANENDFKLDTELSRRFMLFYTDSSKEHVEDVITENAKSRAEIKSIDKKHSLALSNYIKRSLDSDYSGFVDVFSEAFTKYIPKVPKAVGYVNHYYDLLNACAKFHSAERMLDENNHLFLDLEDYYLIHQLYYPNFLTSLKNLSTKGFTNQNEVDWIELYGAGANKMKSMYPDKFQEWEQHQEKFIEKITGGKK